MSLAIFIKTSLIETYSSEWNNIIAHKVNKTPIMKVKRVHRQMQKSSRKNKKFRKYHENKWFAKERKCQLSICLKTKRGYKTIWLIKNNKIPIK